MQERCYDSYKTGFRNYSEMLCYHEEQSRNSKWVRCSVNNLSVQPLDRKSPYYDSLDSFAGDVSQEAVCDTADHLGLALMVNGELYPGRETAYKSLLDRAKIGGSALPKLKRDMLSYMLNACLNLSSSEALVLIRDQKVAAVHSGDATDYSVLPIDELLKILYQKLNARFPGAEFVEGYSDHSITSALWKMPDQKEELLGAYAKTLAAQGKALLAGKLVPGVRFITSDTGVASAKVSALLLGYACPIHIGGCIAIDHRHNAKVEDFEVALDQLFAQFGDSIKKLQGLLDIYLNYPVNTMTRICKKLALPKKAAVEAIAMFENTYGGGVATAHDVFIAMQEILFTLKSEKTPESKMIAVEENMARALTLRWEDYDLAKKVDY